MITVGTQRSAGKVGGQRATLLAEEFGDAVLSRTIFVVIVLCLFATHNTRLFSSAPAGFTAQWLLTTMEDRKAP